MRSRWSPGLGALTAIFAAMVAVAQDDIKRILAYSTVSQLGYMMMGIGVGGVAVGVFHLIAHAFFKALLFLGAGSVIHGLMGEQDIREMGGIRKWMPVTFATYAVGTLALCGFPLFFSGFWSKDAILHAAYGWNVSRVPFYLGAVGALLTAFYMTRQVCYVFFGTRRKGPVPEPVVPAETAASDPHEAAHESPAAMTIPLVLLAGFAVLLGFIGTPAWPWLQAFVEMRHTRLDFGQLAENGLLPLMLASSLLVFAGSGAGLVDLWAKADQARRRCGRTGAVAAGALPRAEERLLRGPALCADDSAIGMVDRERHKLVGSMGLERHPSGCFGPDQGPWVDRFLARPLGGQQGIRRRL